MKKQNGITLIALVITIIVLLILAGVSISLVIGDNGILTQATEAVTENRKGSVTEDVSMAWAGLETEYVRNWTTNTSEPKSNYFNEGNFKAALNSKGEVKDFNFNAITGMTKFKYTQHSNPGKEYFILIDSKGKVSMDVFAAQITPENYGDKVDYTASNGVTGWKIFYNDGEHVFLMLDDFLDITKIDSEDLQNWKMRTYQPHIIVWNGIPNFNLKEEDRQLLRLFKYNHQDTMNANKPSYRCVSVLLNTENWQDFLDVNGKAAYAIGGSTLEMWIESWNQKCNDNLSYSISSEKVYIPSASWISSGDYNYHVNATKYAQLYFSRPTGSYGSAVNPQDGVCAYWLASPGFYQGSDYSINCVMNNGIVCGSNYNGSGAGIGLRPVICLNADVNAEWDKTNQIWKFVD